MKTFQKTINKATFTRVRRNPRALTGLFNGCGDNARFNFRRKVYSTIYNAYFLDGFVYVRTLESKGKNVDLYSYMRYRMKPSLELSIDTNYHEGYGGLFSRYTSRFTSQPSPTVVHLRTLAMKLIAKLGA